MNTGYTSGEDTTQPSDNRAARQATLTSNLPAAATKASRVWRWCKHLWEEECVRVCELQLCNPVTKSLNTAGVRLLPHRTRFSRETPRRQFRFPNVTSPRSFIYRLVPLGGANTHARAHTHTHSPLRLLHYHILYHCIIRAGLYCCSWQWWSVTKYIYLSYCYILGNILRYTSLWRQTSYMFLFQYSYLIF